MHHFKRMYTCNKAINGAVITIYQMYSLFDTICFLIPQIILPNYFFQTQNILVIFIFSPAGYGRVTPLSEAGKGFCILYTVIGIPLTLVLLTALVERLMIPSSWALQWMIRKLGHIYRVFHIKLIHVAVILALVVIFFFLIPAAIYSSLEPKWNYLDAFYYCFISLTTIGLGDYIPGDSPDQILRPLYKVATTCKYAI